MCLFLSVGDIAGHCDCVKILTLASYLFVYLREFGQSNLDTLTLFSCGMKMMMTKVQA